MVTTGIPVLLFFTGGDLFFHENTKNPKHVHTQGTKPGRKFMIRLTMSRAWSLLVFIYVGAGTVRYLTNTWNPAQALVGFIGGLAVATTGP